MAPTRRFETKLLIDGYNLMFQATGGPSSKNQPGELHAARGKLLATITRLIPEELRSRTVVVFDSSESPKGIPDQFEFAGMLVQFTRDWNSADEWIQLQIRQNTNPKQLVVVSSDHSIQRTARARGAQAIDSDVWIDRQLNSSKASIPARSQEQSESPACDDRDQQMQAMGESELNHWMQEFGY